MIESTSWHSYPSIYATGHAALKGFWDGKIIVEEKVDGSQFSFGKFKDGLKVRSKGKEMPIDAPEKMFNLAIETVKKLEPLLNEGWTYRGEFLNKPKHNTLAYDRTPNNYIIIFDINDGHESYLTPTEKRRECERLGLECVPLIAHDHIKGADEVAVFMDRISVLGGQKIEGLVFKDYSKIGVDKKCLMGKYVSEGFKEVHRLEWKASNPNKEDIIFFLGRSFKTEARYNKAIQHLKERGQYEGSPKDIGNLLKEVRADIEKECTEDIAKKLVEWAMPKITRIVTAGLPEWYKDKLLQDSFKPEEAVADNPTV